MAEYEAGVQSEFAQYLELKAAYENNEEAAKIDANYQVLNDRYGDYTSADDYLAKSDTAQNHLADLQKAGAGWTENELLYAISDAIVNKQQGSTDTELKQANISGNNITGKKYLKMLSDFQMLRWISSQLHHLSREVQMTSSRYRWYR